MTRSSLRRFESRVAAKCRVARVIASADSRNSVGGRALCTGRWMIWLDGKRQLCAYLRRACQFVPPRAAAELTCDIQTPKTA